jgi:transposase-like protein
MNEKAEALSVTPVAKCFQATAEAKAEWVRRFIESGLSIRKFSAQHALPRMSLWRWVNKARDETVPVRSSAGPAFTEIKLLPSVERSDWVAELSLPSGMVLRLSKEVPPAMLQQLLGLW